MLLIRLGSSRVGYPASSATQELDDLMMSLNTFKIKEGQATEEPINTTLDDMLGNLQVGCFNKDKNLLVPKYFPRDRSPEAECAQDLCAGCGKPISGRCVIAMLRKFHPGCFVCSFCLKQLKQTFKEQDDKPYCYSCFDRLFGWIWKSRCCPMSSFSFSKLFN